MESHQRDEITADLAPHIAEPAAYAADPPRPIRTLSRLLATVLICASLATTATVVLAVIEAAAGARAVTHTIMLLLTAGSATTWISVIAVISRDAVLRYLRALRADTERIEARQLELYRRQDHLTLCLNNLASQQREQTRILEQIAAKIAELCRGQRDVLELEDADAELDARRQALAANSRPGSGRLRPIR